MKPKRFEEKKELKIIQKHHLAIGKPVKWMKQWMGMLPYLGVITLWLQPIFLLVLFIWNAKITENSAQFSLFWVIEVKCRPRVDGEEFLKTKRGFC